LASSRNHVANLDLHQVAAAPFAIDGEIEERFGEEGMVARLFHCRDIFAKA
jgi:hypothetical protein